jgi:hypothetical protein
MYFADIATSKDWVEERRIQGGEIGRGAQSIFYENGVGRKVEKRKDWGSAWAVPHIRQKKADVGHPERW